ncbi:hypothetical protein J5J10_16755 [Ciceribacter sp. L1K23]|uniref:hypothetical protein n=1 Tax=Ciceribacter sp. L1K23 TaxID=2820276 RepID=UPI001B82AE19|nr:hypothetical protein [Ciceribacter sp. L1K23]MBR0557339.1 hypothetical protein [Ciceribacter sp. L1K23]
MLFLENLLFGIRADAAYTIRRLRRTILFGAIAAVFLLTAYGFAIFALAVALARDFGVVGAALAVSGGATALGVAIIAYVLVANSFERRARLPMSVRLKMATQQAGMAAAGTALTGGGMLGSRPLVSLATVAVVVFAGTRLGLWSKK